MTEEKKMLFSQDALKKLLWPLIIEQFLAVAMGMADTVMVASCGEAAVSGISLVDSICVLLIGLFTAMASGGAVVAAQYMGRGDKEMVGRASNQLFLAVGGVALLFMAVSLIFNRGLLSLLYGNVEADVMSAARIYFYIVAVSFPFLGIYNGGAALFRAVGDSKVSMKVSLVANLMNIAGNAILIYGAKIGVAGAALSTLLSRILSAVMIVVLLTRSDKISMSKSWRVDKNILSHRYIWYGGHYRQCRDLQHCQFPADSVQCHWRGHDYGDRAVHWCRRDGTGSLLSEKNDSNGISVYDRAGNSYYTVCTAAMQYLPLKPGDHRYDDFFAGV